MASSSICSFGFVVSLAVLLPFLLISSVSASNKFINVICQHVANKAFCVQTLNAYPPAVSATSELQAASATLHLVISHAKKCAAFAGKNPSLKESQDAFVTIKMSLNSALLELKQDPDTANYDVMVCGDSTKIVKDLVGKNADQASKTLMSMTLMMDKLLAIAVGATVAVGG